MAFPYEQKDGNEDAQIYCPYGVARSCFETNCAIYDKSRKKCAHLIIAQVMARQIEEEDLERERQELLNGPALKLTHQKKKRE